MGTQVVLSAAMSIMHPEMYELGRDAMLKLWELSQQSDEQYKMSNILCLWSLVYNSLSIMVNHCSPFHTNSNNLQQWFNLLLIVGNYEDVHFQMPQLHMAFRYAARTVLAFSGGLLEHGVMHVAGDRGCIAWYMQEKVHDVLGINRCNFTNVSNMQE